MKDSEELFQQVLHNVIPNYTYQFMLLYWQLAELYPTKAAPSDNFSTHNLIKFEYLRLRFSKICTCTKLFFVSCRVSVREKKQPLLSLLSRSHVRLENSLYQKASTCFGATKCSLAALPMSGAQAHWGVIQIRPRYTTSVKEFIHADTCRTDWPGEGRAVAGKEGQGKTGFMFPSRI